MPLHDAEPAAGHLHQVHALPQTEQQAHTVLDDDGAGSDSDGSVIGSGSDEDETPLRNGRRGEDDGDDGDVTMNTHEDVYHHVGPDGRDEVLEWSGNLPPGSDTNDVHKR